MNLTKISISIVLVIYSCNHHKSANNIQTIWIKEIDTLNISYINSTFNEISNELIHCFEPWQKIYYSNYGLVQFGEIFFVKKDTLIMLKKDFEIYKDY